MNGHTASFRQFIIKVASRCDLACDHCYVYEHADQSWRAQPKVIADETISRVAWRIAEHARGHRLSSVHVIMHGGEPLLAGPARLERVARELEQALDPGVKLDLRVHTNGVMLSDAFCRVFDAANIKVGVSIDGDRAANDRHRRYANGRSSYDRVISAIELLRGKYPHLYAGLLCTIDIRNDPIKVYEALLELEPPRVDFLLPHATWDSPPMRPHHGDTAYADWLIAIHDRWVADGRPLSIRLFDSITWNARGQSGGTEALGLAPSDLIVIETDGSYEQVDSLKVAYDGAPAMGGLHVDSHSLDEAMGHPGVAARRGGVSALCADCRACPIVASCGGGLYTHRHRTGTGFANPSVYCSDLRKLIPHVEAATRRRHVFPVAAFDLLARLNAGPGEVEALRGPQQSIARSMLAAAGRHEGGVALDLLARLNHAHRAVTDPVLEYPYVRSWAARMTGRVPAGQTVISGHLAAVAAVSAVLAVADAAVTVPVTDGYVYLPTLGRMRVGDGTSAVIKTTGGVFTIESGGRRFDQNDVNWEPVRTLRAPGITLLFDDIDPHRGCYSVPARERLTPSDWEIWQKTFEAAWSLLQEKDPGQAAAIRAGLRVITPIAGEPGRFGVARHAYGAVALPECVDPETLARLLAGGFASGQFAALRDMIDFSRNARAADELQDCYARLVTASFLEPGAEGAELLSLLQIMEGWAEDTFSGVGRRFLEGMKSAALTRLAVLDI